MNDKAQLTITPGDYSSIHVFNVRKKCSESKMCTFLKCRMNTSFQDFTGCTRKSCKITQSTFLLQKIMNPKYHITLIAYYRRLTFPYNNYASFDTIEAKIGQSFTPNSTFEFLCEFWLISKKKGPKIYFTDNFNFFFSKLNSDL